MSYQALLEGALKTMPMHLIAGDWERPVWVLNPYPHRVLRFCTVGWLHAYAQSQGKCRYPSPGAPGDCQDVAACVSRNYDLHQRAVNDLQQINDATPVRYRRRKMIGALQIWLEIAWRKQKASLAQTFQTFDILSETEKIINATDPGVLV